MSTITLTFAEAGENNVGNEIVGSKSSSGYTLNDLQVIQSMFSNNPSIIYDLRTMFPEMYDSLDEAYILLVRNPFYDIVDNLYRRLTSTEVTWDSKALFRGQVKNKNARHNLLFSDLGSNYIREAQYEVGKGTIYNYRAFDEMSRIMDTVSNFPNGPIVVIEGNYYYDVSKTYIGFHGDTERSKVIGLRLGATLPLHFQWYHRFERVGTRFSLDLYHGDFYVMSGKAVGTDWKSSSKFTLRHAAGYESVVAKHSKK